MAHYNIVLLTYLLAQTDNENNIQNKQQYVVTDRESKKTQQNRLTEKSNKKN